MKKTILFLAIALIAFSAKAMNTDHQALNLNSPDGRFKLSFDVDANGRPFYHLDFDGKTVVPSGRRIYLKLNKPRGYVSTMSDEKGRKCPDRYRKGRSILLLL